MNNDSIPSLGDSEEERVRRAEELLARRTNQKSSSNNNNDWVPAWSSVSLERTVEMILGVPEGKTNDLFQGLWNLLGHTQAPLNGDMTEFLLAIVRLAINSRYRRQWQQTNFGWMMTALKKGSTAAQAYLTFLLLNEEHLTACKEDILVALRNSEFLHRALHAPGIWSSDILPYGHYQIEPVEMQIGVADGVVFEYWTGARLGTIMNEVHDDQERERVRPFDPRIQPPSHWQELIQKRLDDEDEA